MLETAGGILFLIVSPGKITQFVFAITRHELVQDPDDWFANSLRHAFGHFSSGEKLFGSVYLLAHGVIKILLVGCLLRERLWAFPLALIVLAGFIGYQVFRLSFAFSWGLVFLSVLDAVVVLLVVHEYRYLKNLRGRRRR